MKKQALARLILTAEPRTGITWLRNADACAVFAAGGRLPSEKAGDPAEKRLGRWLAGERRNPNLAEARADYLDAAVPGWRTNALELIWDGHLGAVRAFRERNGRLPSEDAADPVELALGQWLAKQCEQNRRPRGLSGTRRQKLDAALPGWQLKLAEETWLQDATELGVFMALNKHRPSRKSGDPTELRLGVWLHNMRRRLDGSKPGHTARIALLDELAPGWH